MSKVEFDGGGFPMFDSSYHDVRLPPHLVGPTISDGLQFRYAFDDFARALREDPNWRENFSPEQVRAIEEAIAANNPRIHGFVWHHHQDYGVMQLVGALEHRSVGHYGGRFVTGGRKRYGMLPRR